MVKSEEAQGVVVVFVAGPLLNGGHVEQWRNVRAAIVAADALMAHGYVPLVPHLSMLSDMVCPQERERDWAWWAQELLTRCDAVVLSGAADPEALEGGTYQEVALAKRLGIPVFKSPEDMRASRKPVAVEGDGKLPCNLELRLLAPEALCGKCGWPAGNHRGYPHNKPGGGSE